MEIATTMNQATALKSASEIKQMYQLYKDDPESFIEENLDPTEIEEYTFIKNKNYEETFKQRLC